MRRRQCLSGSSSCAWLGCAVALGSVLLSLSFFLRPQKTTILLNGPLDRPLNEEAAEAIQRWPSKSCLDLAKAYPEPDGWGYHQRKIDPDGPVYAHYNWTMPIEKGHLEIQKSLTTGDCRILYKVMDRKLYIETSSLCYKKLKLRRHATVQGRHAALTEMLLITLAVYDVPDVDFVVNLEDTVVDSKWEVRPMPVMSYSLRVEPPEQGLKFYARHSPTAGFTIPSYGIYWDALGKQQMAFANECIKMRHPLNNRIKKAVWRGRTTGIDFESADDVYKVRRVSLAFLGTKASDVLDVGIMDYVQVTGKKTEVYKAFRAMAPLHKKMKMEDYNKYMAVIDVDGNGWSDRLPWLLLANTPILKQEYSSWKEYFGHLVTEEHVGFFKEDLSDLVKQSEHVIKTWDSDRQKWELQMQRAFAFSQEHLSQQGVIRATAYALTKYASFLTWKVEMEDDYLLVDSNICCKSNEHLPTAFVKRVQERTFE